MNLRWWAEPFAGNVFPFPVMLYLLSLSLEVDVQCKTGWYFNYLQMAQYVFDV